MKNEYNILNMHMNIKTKIVPSLVAIHMYKICFTPNQTSSPKIRAV